MVKETRIIFDTKDIKAVRIRCNVKDCGGGHALLFRETSPSFTVRCMR